MTTINEEDLWGNNTGSKICKHAITDTSAINKLVVLSQPSSVKLCPYITQSGAQTLRTKEKIHFRVEGDLKLSHICGWLSLVSGTHLAYSCCIAEVYISLLTCVCLSGGGFANNKCCKRQEALLCFFTLFHFHWANK